MNSIEKSLFVYGSLAPGRSNEHILHPINGSWQPARVKGKLFEGGWGSALGYPGLKVEYDGEVSGYLFTSEYLPAFWSRLDEFEGESYDRTPITVILENQVNTRAYCYLLK